jgi:hypothetical protein
MHAVEMTRQKAVGGCLCNKAEVKILGEEQQTVLFNLVLVHVFLGIATTGNIAKLRLTTTKNMSHILS